jgi:hypothetical protein
MQTNSDQVLEQSRREFLFETKARAAISLRQVEFDRILDVLIEWSQEASRALVVRNPGAQKTVSFGMPDPGHVLWIVYPRYEDGAKVVILPQRFNRLPSADREKLVRKLELATPSVRIDSSGLLQVPMHLLKEDRAMIAFRHVLETAYEVGRR